ncbi:MAG: DNA repair protein [Clostridia bacterium]|nr:DNA repair protein [Clostridia bacterium]
MTAPKKQREGNVTDERKYLCIDLKSFYASVECVERGLDPFRTPLVVADPSRGPGSICLAASPAIKALGVRNRCRVFEIPKTISYITAVPRMRLYMQKSAEINNIYRRFFSDEDLYVYSVDECFIDVTDYLSYYRCDASELARKAMDAVFDQTGICATAGVGSNLFQAKVALDLLAKHAPDHIGVLDDASFRAAVWHHRPITDIWNIGPGIARRLKKYGVLDLYGITCLPEETLFREFGTEAVFLMDHALGKESCTLADIRSYRPKTRSLSRSQVLFRTYHAGEAEIVLREMVEQAVLELIDLGKTASGISLWIGYQDEGLFRAGLSRKLPFPSSSVSRLSALFLSLYRENVLPSVPIRRLGLSLDGLQEEGAVQMTLFSSGEDEDKERSLSETLITIRKKYGQNAVLKGYQYLSEATGRERNGLIGGHRA